MRNEEGQGRRGERKDVWLLETISWARGAKDRMRGTVEEDTMKVVCLPNDLSENISRENTTMEGPSSCRITPYNCWN